MRVPFRSVLCPTDLTPIGNLAAAVAYGLVAGGGTVHLLHVQEPPVGNPLYPDDAPKGAPTPQQLSRAAEDRRAQLLGLSPPDAKARGIRTEVDLAEGHDVALTIESEALSKGAEVVVLSSHGRWGLARVVHGEPVALRLLHRASLDVIVVHTDRP